MDKKQTDPVYVTRPFLPPLEEFYPYLQQIWEKKQLTNGGPFHQELEVRLADYLGVEHLALFANGTLALMTALQTLRITGEVITTPFSFVATAHSLLWNGIEPVFVDIHPETFNLDPDKIEAAITPRTTAIMPVHVYGKPCNLEGIQRVADTYNLKVIYDAAHAFGVHYKGKSLLAHGDLSTLSFHATKVFNTFEGGAIVCPDANTKKRIDDLKNFGFHDEVTVVAPGINAKMNEVQAAFGLLQLKHIDKAIERRREIDKRYRQKLANVGGISLPALPADTKYNFAYFPILVEKEYPLTRDELNDKLREHGIFPRRYFYPLISDFPMYRNRPSAVRQDLPVAHDIAERVLCLPIYPDLEAENAERIIAVIEDPYN
ncbi:MAG: DegT/DnrJ/EryC1/StrS family aminotransferase [Syntrophales bacterium]|jgi:dTDP-4-amino-4,6-dideoxygalactose transaminase|nr:DegT/DnrJ/EryC1/StrS family aminotransferase [Syntrophales bacterium]